MLWSKQIIVSRKLVSSPGLMGMGSLWWETTRTEHQAVLLCQERPKSDCEENSESTHCLMIASLLHNCQCQTYTQKTLSNLKEASVTWIAPCIPERLSSEGVEYGLCPACQTVSSDTATANKALYERAWHRAAREIKAPGKHRQQASD